MASPPPPPEPASVVLAIDPGSVKCGLAVVRRPAKAGDPPDVLHRDIVERERLVARVLPLLSGHDVTVILMGNATGGSVLARAIEDALPEPLPVLRVDEAFTSQRARQRFLSENPPRGLRRLLPSGFQSPDRPYDDYVAVLLAEDYFAATS